MENHPDEFISVSVENSFRSCWWARADETTPLTMGPLRWDLVWGRRSSRYLLQAHEESSMYKDQERWTEESFHELVLPFPNMTSNLHGFALQKQDPMSYNWPRPSVWVKDWIEPITTYATYIGSMWANNLLSEVTNDAQTLAYSTEWSPNN